MENSEISYQKVTEIEKAYSKDPGKRGITPLTESLKDQLWDAANSISTHPNPHIAIISGFYIPEASPPGAETDGPVGLAHLAAGLVMSGIPVSVVTNSLCFNVIETALKAVNMEALIPMYKISASQELENFNHPIEHTKRNWDEAKPPVSHVISIEYPGPSYDEVPRNMKGDDISLYTIPLYKLFDMNDYITIGIGDGGNEMGMGKLSRKLISESIIHGEHIASWVPCHHLLVTGVSNWAVYGLLSSLAILIPEKSDKLLSTMNLRTDHHILHSIVYNSFAVDGVLGKQSLSVDGLTWEYNARVMEEILSIYRK